MTVAAGFDGEVRAGTLGRDGSLGLPAREGDPVVFGQRPPSEVAHDEWKALRIGAAPWASGDFAFFGEALHVEPGLRFEPNVRATSKVFPVIGDAPRLGDFQADPAFEPRLVVRYAPVPALELRAAHAVVHQAPQMSDTSAVFGTPTLAPSASTQEVLGAKTTIAEGLSADVAVFLASNEALAVRNPSPSPLLAQALVTTGEGRNYGAQVVLRQETRAGFMGWVSYALARSVRRADDASTWRYSDYDQTHLLTAVASYDLGAGYDVGLRARYATGFPRTPVVGTYRDLRADAVMPRFGSVNTDRLPAFFQLDLHAAKRWQWGDHELELALDVQNATNRANGEEYVYSVDFTRRDTIRGIPLLAMAGLRWRY